MRPGEHKTVQARVLAYAQEIGWSFVSRAEAKQWRGFDMAATSMEERARLIWHAQGSGKTYTMIKAAELLFRDNEAGKPIILLMIDRNDLEDQVLKNLGAMEVSNIAHANRIFRLSRRLDEQGGDYRGIVVTMIRKFRDMPAGLNTRSNIFVLIDEAHRTTGGDFENRRKTTAEAPEESDACLSGGLHSAGAPSSSRCLRGQGLGG